MMLQSELRDLRQRLGLTQEELAGRLGYSRKTIQRWERGESTPRRAVMKCLQQLVAERRSTVSLRQPQFTFVDLFAGIGGMRLAFESVGGRCVFTSEWDRFCRITYEANFDCDHALAGDIREVPCEQIPPHDVLLAGFPCQPFSIAGVSKKNALGHPHGFACETQGTLFFEIARILNSHRPAAFVLENVKHLANHNGGRTYEVIMRTLREELGYHVLDGVVDARGFVPQHRERLFLIGFRELTDFSWDDIHSPDPAEGPRLTTILHPQDGTEPAEPPYTEGDLARVSDKYTLSNQLWSYLREYAEKHRRRGNGFGYGLVTPRDVARTLSARYYKDGSEILIAQNDRNPRRLTPRECARLMGFDRPERSPFEIPVSDTQAYKQFGNAVVVPVVEAIAKAMCPYLEVLTAGAEQLEFPALQPSA